MVAYRPQNQANFHSFSAPINMVIVYLQVIYETAVKPC